MGRNQAPDVAEEVIDVRNDEEDRYVDESEAMEILTNALDDGFVIFALTYDEINDDDPEQGDFDDSIGIGVSGTLSGDTVDITYVVAYEDSDDVDLDDLEEWVDAQDNTTFDDVDDISYNQSNRAGIITGEMDADDVELFG